MNFLGHAVIASERARTPAFVLGAMLPDLAAMAGGRLREVGHPDAGAGVALHHRTDEVFHASRRFGELVREATVELSTRGLRRGPARGVGHVGIELLLDGWWVREHGLPQAYAPALAAAAEVTPTLGWHGEAASGRLESACARIAERGLAERYVEPAFVAERLVRVLARRPRLALQHDEPVLVAAWCEAAAPRVAAAGPGLFGEVRTGLQATSADRAPWYAPAP